MSPHNSSALVLLLSNSRTAATSAAAYFKFWRFKYMEARYSNASKLFGASRKTALILSIGSLTLTAMDSVAPTSGETEDSSGVPQRVRTKIVNANRTKFFIPQKCTKKKAPPSGGAFLYNKMILIRSCNAMKRSKYVRNRTIQNLLY